MSEQCFSREAISFLLISFSKRTGLITLNETESPLNNVDSVLHKRVTRKNDLDLYVHVRVRVDGCALTDGKYLHLPYNGASIGIRGHSLTSNNE